MGQGAITLFNVEQISLFLGDKPYSEKCDGPDDVGK
jgi:hypothetical protein